MTTAPLERNLGGRPRNRKYELRYRSISGILVHDTTIVDRDPDTAIRIGQHFCEAHGVKFVGLQEQTELSREILDQDAPSLQTQYPIGAARFIR